MDGGVGPRQVGMLFPMIKLQQRLRAKTLGLATWQRVMRQLRRQCEARGCASLDEVEMTWHMSIWSLNH